MHNWVECNDNIEDIVISSRIRLARNIKATPFPNIISNEEGRNLVTSIEDAFFSSDSMKENYNCVHLWEMDKVSNISFLEKHLISKKLIENSNKSAFISDKDETVSIMINEEDHIRLQCISSGGDLKDIWSYCEKLDDYLEEKMEYAFDEKLGYLTACPTNLGTGLRASVMMHLPALTFNNEMSGVLNALTQVGMTIRGLYGEGSGAYSNLYQISNQLTLGINEKDILSNLKAVVNQLITQEHLSREQTLKKYNYEIEDKIYRSLGILRYAVTIDIKECLKLLSNVRMGVEMGIIKDVSKGVLNDILVNTQPATLNKKFDTKLAERELNLKRAQYIREKLR